MQIVAKDYKIILMRPNFADLELPWMMPIAEVSLVASFWSFAVRACQYELLSRASHSALPITFPFSSPRL